MASRGRRERRKGGCGQGGRVQARRGDSGYHDAFIKWAGSHPADSKAQPAYQGSDAEHLRVRPIDSQTRGGRGARIYSQGRCGPSLYHRRERSAGEQNLLYAKGGTEGEGRTFRQGAKGK